MTIHGHSFGLHDISPLRGTIAPRLLSLPLILACVVALLGLAGAVLLWAYIGSTVFFETIRSGFALCG